MICSNCSQPISDGVKFCTECGSRVATAVAQPSSIINNDVERVLGEAATRDANAQARGRQSATSNPNAMDDVKFTVKKKNMAALVVGAFSVILIVCFGLIALIDYDSNLSASRDESRASSSTSSTAARSESASQPAPTTASVPNTADDTYTAYLTCGMNGFENINVLACFANKYGGTTLEIHNGAAYGLYEVNELPSLGTDTERGFAIKLKHNFALNMKNASEILKLGVRIYNDRTGQQVYVKQVGEFGTIDVSN